MEVWWTTTIQRTLMNFRAQCDFIFRQKIICLHVVRFSFQLDYGCSHSILPIFSNVLQFIESHRGAEWSSCSGPLAGPDLKASIHVLLLISDYCSSSACFLASLLYTALLPWLARRNISALLQNRIPTQAATSSIYSLPFKTTQLEYRSVLRKAVVI